MSTYHFLPVVVLLEDGEQIELCRPLMKAKALPLVSNVDTLCSKVGTTVASEIKSSVKIILVNVK